MSNGSFTVEPISKIFSDLSIHGLGEFNSETGVYLSWPDVTVLKGYSATLFLAFDYPLPYAAREEIEELLSSLEQEFTIWLADLHASQGKTENRDMNRVAVLGGRLSRLQKLILKTEHPVHAAYPFFLRWFAMHATFLKACEGLGCGAGCCEFFQLLGRVVAYVHRVLGSSLAARAQQVRVGYTGIRNDMPYISDMDYEMPLTETLSSSIAQDSEDEVTALRHYLAIAAQCETLVAMRITAIGAACDSLLAAQVIPEWAPQPPLKRSTLESIQGVQAALENDLLEAWKPVSGKVSLFTPEVNPLFKSEPQGIFVKLSEPPSLPDQQGIAALIGPLAKAIARAISGLSGKLPVPGAGHIDTATDLFLEWILGAPPIKWDKVREEVQRMIKKALSEADRRRIDLEVRKVESALDLLNREIHDESKPHCIKKAKNREEFEKLAAHWRPQAAVLLADAQKLETEIFRPGDMHDGHRAVTMPFLDRAIMNLLGSYSLHLALNPDSNHDIAFLRLLNGLLTYIRKVHEEVCKERVAEIREFEGAWGTNYHDDRRHGEGRRRQITNDITADGYYWMTVQARNHHYANAKVRAFGLLTTKSIQRVNEALAPIYNRLGRADEQKILNVQQTLVHGLYSEHINARNTVNKWSQHDQNRLFPNGYFPGNTGYWDANMENPHSQKCAIDPW